MAPLDQRQPDEVRDRDALEELLLVTDADSSAVENLILDLATEPRVLDSMWQQEELPV